LLLLLVLLLLLLLVLLLLALLCFHQHVQPPHQVVLLPLFLLLSLHLQSRQTRCQSCLKAGDHAAIDEQQQTQATGSS
jgi:hypothetical protein